jgi:hypothetical protein
MLSFLAHPPFMIFARETRFPQIEGRMSSMAKQAQQRVGLLQGTLDMLILRTLLYGPAHGHQIGQMAEAVARVMWPAAEEN